MLLVLSLSAASAPSFANYCGELTNAYGPYDYRDRANLKANLKIVEDNHFTPEVEKLIAGKSSSIGGDLDYTLRAFPNHHRALTSVARLAVRSKSPSERGMKYSFECYFNRAVRFQPDDPVVRTIYGSYLSKVGRWNEALEHLSEAVRLQPDNPTSNYNLALVYFEKQDYEQARLYAKKAYDMEFPLPGLKNKLIQRGKWGDETAK
ncbi:tetratricopeptide repeat protein [Noviherbaspirillum sp. ST9]|uniref:tetratricopeptide repeat protein n=1 Tax=Noviherbaspirillum sp. ST9 TaxID=3401606 RepID=UPI003B588791